MSHVRGTTFTVATAGPGRLSTVARPRGGDWHADEIAGVREAGADVVACTLTAPELREVELTEKAAAAESAGVR